LVLALAPVFLTAADNTTKAMNMITQTTTTKAKITVFDPFRWLLRVEFTNQKRGPRLETQPKREKRLPVFILR
jgi:hypothetical protein